MKRCKFIHFRIPEFVETGAGDYVGGPAARGGATVAYTMVDGQCYAAAAFCNPTDNFN